jgi:molybdate transport repressor ModE-like protein
MSYRHAWGMIRQIEEKLENPILVTHKGGKDGGGGSKLTMNGMKLLETFLKLRNAFDQVISDIHL